MAVRALDPRHGWLHILSDGGVWAAYFAIPLVLGYFAARRRDLPFRRVFLLFVAFILLCGTTHLMEAVIFWWPAYRLAGALKLLTAVVSWVTVLALVRVAPAVLAMRTPAELEREVAARTDAERRLTEANAELERRVDERTADLGRAVEAEAEQTERLRTTLASIGDAVISTDRDGTVTYLNAVAESLTGWANADATGRPLDAVFHVVNESTRLPVENPALRALREGVIVGLANHTVLVARDGTERPIDDSAAPIRCRVGELVGCVLVFRDISERHRQEAALRDRERQFRTLAESIPQLTWMANPDGHIFWYNRRWYDYTGTTPEQMEGWGWQSVHDPDELPGVLERWKGSVATGEPFDMVFPLKGKDGAFRPFLTRVEPVKDDAGRVVRWFGTNTDISEQREAERQARRREAFIGGVLGSITDGFFAVDRDWRLTFANDEFARRIGRPRGEVAGDLWRTFPDAAGGHAHAQLHRAMADRVAVEYEVYHESLRVWVLDKAFPTDDGGLAVYTRDITDRKRAEVALRASEVRYRRLFESAKDGILILDAHAATITEANPFIADMLGYSPGEFVGKELWQIGLFRDAAASKAAVRELQAKGYIRYADLPLETKAGRRISVEFVSNVYGEGGEAVIQCNVRDITDRTRLEESLRRHAAELSDADRRKDEFLATLAHELRNPLAPIRNGLQLMRLAGVGGAVETARSMMDRQVTQLVRLVDDLLDISRVTGGKLALRRGRIDLRAVAAAAVETSRPAIEQAGHELSVALPGGPVFVDGDATRLAQVVSNLLNNSAKYTRRGGHVRLAVGRDGGAAVVSVADDGIGIPPPMLGRVFEMFTQVDRTLEKTTGGLGIGLSLVKGLVEMHGGTVEARSGGDGTGSEFVVRLPVAPPAPAPPSDRSDESGEGVVTPPPRRVLVVDDNADAADSLGQLLQLLGSEVRTAYDGEAGVRAAGEFRPAVVICDIGMPKLNGYEAARRIRAEPWGRGMVLVAVTGWGQDDDRRKSADAGFDHHLVKPVEAAALTKLLAGLPAAG